MSLSTQACCQGDRGAIGWSRIPIARIRCKKTGPYEVSRSRIRYRGAWSHGNASVTWREIHSAVGFAVTPNDTQSRRPWRTMTRQYRIWNAIDLFVLPTIAFQILYCLVIVRHGRRLWVSFGVTANPTAEWISRQVTEAFPWDHAPRYLIRDRDTSYGPVFLQRIRAMGIRDHPIAPRSPWQNAYVERLIGSIRREC